MLHSPVDVYGKYLKKIHYSLLVTLDQSYIAYIFKSRMQSTVLFLFAIASLLFLFLIYFLYILVISPITRMKNKLNEEKFIYEKGIVLKELAELDKVLIDDIKLIESIINATDDLVFFKDKAFNYLGCNDAFLKFVGKQKKEIIGHNDFELFSKEMATIFRTMDIEMLQLNKTKSNYEWVEYPNKERVYLHTQKIPFVYDSEGNRGILGISRDVTELHLAYKEIEKQSFEDELTKVYNRKAYNKHIEELLAMYERYQYTFSILMYDIDKFKLLNDEYGHQMGDQVLLQMSTLIKAQLRMNDYIYRVGGEEFVILFPHTKIVSAQKIAQKIRRSVEEELKTIENKKITISIGVTQVEAKDTADSIYKRVDEYLYAAKNSGRNRVVSGESN